MKIQRTENGPMARSTTPGWYERAVPPHPETTLSLVCSYEGGRYGRTRMQAYDGDRFVHSAFYDYARWEGHAGGQLLMANFVAAAEQARRAIVQADEKPDNQQGSSQHAVRAFLVDEDQLARLRQLSDLLHAGSDKERDIGHKLLLVVSDIERQEVKD